MYASLHLNVDDTYMYFSAPPHRVSELYNKLNIDIESIFTFCLHHSLCLTLAKLKAILFAENLSDMLLKISDIDVTVQTTAWNVLWPLR